MFRLFFPCLLLGLATICGCESEDDLPEDQTVPEGVSSAGESGLASGSEPWGIVAATGHGGGTNPTLQILSVSPEGVITLEATGLDPSDCDPNAGNRTDFDCGSCPPQPADQTGPKGQYIEVVTTYGVVHPQPVENEPDHYTATVPGLQESWVYGYVRRGCGEIIPSTMVSHSIGNTPEIPSLHFGIPESALPTFCCSYPPHDAIPLDFAYWHLPPQGTIRLIVQRAEPSAIDTLSLPQTGGDFHGIYHLTDFGSGSYDLKLQMIDSGGAVVAEEQGEMRVL